MTVSSPENKVLQNINVSYTRLDNKYADILHYKVAKILLVEKRVRPDIEPAIPSPFHIK